ncbi:MAG: TonB-dependent receptor, partial [Ketobacteraceae bacterium]|nr:TonB-dependent receptor [Ketobacteraceae bacterium]
QAYGPKYIIRGISSRYNPEVLVMFNGVPIKSSFVGNRSNLWAGMPVKSIERIEIIRGPGSALYGADAFSGVINIITKTAANIEHTRAGLIAGSFDTYGGFLQHRFEYEALRTGFVFEYVKTDGHRGTVREDAQTLFDEITGTDASLAPGSVNVSVTRTEFHGDFQLHDLVYKLSYQKRENIGTGIGLAQALDPNGRFESTRVLNDLRYHSDFSENLKTELQLTYYYDTQEPVEDNLLYPPGAVLGGAFPNGVIGNPGYKEDQWRANIGFVYEGLSNHIVRAGFGGYWGDMYETTESKNFDASLSPRPGGLEDVSDTDEEYLGENSEHSRYIYLQDEWRIQPGAVLTAGVRYDHYSNFGESYNPRLGLVLELNKNLTTRILYGEAFRAPSYVEQYITTNPVALGNKGLDPETIETSELAFTHTANDNFTHTLNFFYYEIDDFIDYEPVADTPARMAQNAGKRHGYGLEWDGHYQPGDTITVNANYAYQKSIDHNTDADVGEAPNHQAYLRVQWAFADNWRFTPQVLWVGDQGRAAGDDRSDTPAYTKVDLTLERTRWQETVDLKLTVKNLFDEDIREPSPGPAAGFDTAFVPGDFPQAGRSVVAELSWVWR